MKKRIILIVLLLSLCCNACTTKQKITESEIDKVIPVESILSNHYDFTKNILKDDVYVYNYNDKNTYLISLNGAKEIKDIITNNISIESQKLYGQKYAGFEGSDNWLNPIIEYNVSSSETMELFKDSKEFENVYLLTSNDNKLLLNSYNSKDERWDIGKGKTFEYDIKNKSTKEITFEFYKDYEKASIICADFCGNGYVISFAYMDSRKTIAIGNGTKTVLIDANGKTIKYLNLGSKENKVNVYKNLKSSPDGNKLIFSDGSTGANVYMYDIQTEKTMSISEKNVIQPSWSKKHNSIYYSTIEHNEEKVKYFLHRYDLQ